MKAFSLILTQIADATLAAVVMNIYINSMYSFSQAHFGVGGMIEPSNTTLLQWEALGLLPVNRVSVKITD